MKFTIDAFGKPFIAEWQSDDRRRYSSRSECLELHSFPYLKQSDNEALTLNHPIRFAWGWIEYPQWCGEKINADEEIEVIALPPYLSESDKWLSPCYQIIQEELYRAGSWNGESGVHIVVAVLEGNTVLFLRPETGRWRQVPILARQYFLAEDEAGRFAQLEVGQRVVANAVQQISNFKAATPENKTERLVDPVPFGFDEWDTLVATLLHEGLTKRDAMALTLYAYGMTRRQSAEYVGISAKTVARKLQVARGTIYKKLFTRSRGERTKARQKLTDGILAQLRQRYLESLEGSQTVLLSPSNAQ
jgi:hypothetical protein